MPELPVAAIVHNRRRLSLERARPVPEYFHRSGIGTTAPPEIIQAIASHVYAIGGSKALVAMCGTCRLWRQWVLEDDKSALCQAMKFFRADRKTMPLVMYNINFGDIARENDDIAVGTELAVSTELQARMIVPVRMPADKWTSATFPATAENAVQCIFGEHPGTVLVLLRPAVKSRRGGAIWAPGDHADLPLIVESPFLGGDFCAYTSQHGRNPCVYTETSVHTPNVHFGQRIRSWSVVLPAPVAESVPLSATNSARASELALTISTSWFSPVDPGRISSGVFYFSKAANEITPRSQRFLTPDGRVVCVRTEYARFLAILVLVSSEPERNMPHPAERAACERELCQSRPYVRSAAWTLRHAAGAFHLWLKPRVVGSIPIVNMYRAEAVAAPFDVDRPGNDRTWGRSLCDVIGHMSRRPEVYASRDMIGTPAGWRMLVQAMPDCKTKTQFYRINRNLEVIGREFRDKYAARVSFEDRHKLNAIPHNRRIINSPVRELFAEFYLERLRFRPTTRLTTPEVGFASLFAASSFFLWMRQQPTIFVDPHVQVARNFLALKASTKRSVYGVLNHKLRMGELPGDLLARQNHRDRLAVYFDLENTLFGRPLTLLYLAGQAPAALDAVVPNNVDAMEGYPVWQKLAKEPTVSIGTMQNLITLCRRVAETMVPLDRVPVIFSKPHANAPNIHRKTSCWHTFDARDPAWDSQRVEPPADGIRVKGGTDRAARMPPPPPDEQLPTSYGVFACLQEPHTIQVHVHHVLKNPDGDDVLYGSVSDGDAEPLCASDALSYVWPPELGINGAHTITTTGLCMMACDWVAHRLLEYGRADVVSPELMGFVAHMALALSMPENGTLWQKQYETYAKRGSERYDRGLLLIRTEQSQAQSPTPPQHTRRFGHPLGVLAPAQLRDQTKHDNLAPLLSPFMTDFLVRIESDLNGGAVTGWVWLLAKHYIAKVSAAFDLWAPSPDVYYNRVLLLATQFEQQLDFMCEQADNAKRAI